MSSPLLVRDSPDLTSRYPDRPICRSAGRRSHLGSVEPNTPDLPVLLAHPDGTDQPRTIRGARPTSTLGELADLLAPGRGAEIVGVEGVRHPRSVTLETARVRAGSRIELDPVEPGSPSARVALVAIGGPDTGRCVLAAPGRFVLGSSPAVSGHLADPDLHPHHALVEVGSDGRVWITDLGVGRPIEIDGQLPRSATVQLQQGQRARIGATILEVADPPPMVAPVPPAPGTWTEPLVRRATRSIPELPPIRPPERASGPSSGPSGIGVTSTVVAVLTGLGAGLLLHQPMLLVLSVLGAVGALASGLVSGYRRKRSDRRAAALRAVDDARFAAELDAHAAALTARLRSPLGWSAVIEGATVGSPWARRASDPTAWDVVVGRGALDWCCPVVDGGVAGGGGNSGETVRRVLDDVGISVPMVPHTVLALTGPRYLALGAARAEVLQLVTSLGPADLRVIVASDDIDAWRWATWLPHAAADGQPLVTRVAGLDAISEQLDPDDQRPTLLVLDGAELLATRTSAARRLLDQLPDVRAVLVTAGVPPARCTAELAVGRGVGRLTMYSDPSGRCTHQAAEPTRVLVTGASTRTALAVARRLAGWHDPEERRSSASVAQQVDLLDLLGPRATSAPDIARRWDQAGVDPAPRAALGAAADGVVEIDLERDGPHALIAGTTGAGKSELLRSLVLGLAAASPPEQLSFVLVDYKGGSAFVRCTALPHVVGVVTDLDHHLAARMLASLHAELRRRESVLRAVGAADLRDYRRLPGIAPLARLVVIVDEFAALAAELPEFLASLVGIAQRGRSLGVHLVLATQRPSGVVSDDIRANTNLRLALRVQDPADSHDVVGDRRAAALPRRCPGRAVLRFGVDELVEFQTARCTGPAPGSDRGMRLVGAADGATWSATAMTGETTLDVLVAAIAAAAARRDHPAPPRPWTEPLPAVLNVRGLGELDDVATQARRPLEWAAGSGHLLVAGMVGSGTSSALIRIALTTCREHSPEALHLFTIDASTALAPLAALPHCAGAAELLDPEGLMRLIVRLEQQLDRGGVTTLAVVDGVSSLRAWLSHPERMEWADRFERLVADGPRSGLTFVFATDQPGALPLAWLARTPVRWIGRLADAADGIGLGLPSGAVVTTGAPGRFVVRGDDGSLLEAQISAGTSSVGDEVAELAAGWASCRHPVRIAALPRRLEAAAIEAEPSNTSGVLRLPLGVGSLDGRPAVLELHTGDHAVVTGPARSGRTNALALLAAQARRADPNLRVAQLDGRGGRALAAELIAELGALPAGASVLVLADEADRIDDPTGELARLVTTERAGVHVVIAGRPDALRGAGYGHWTGVVRRSRRGLLLGAVQDTDTDVIGVPVPRRQLLRGVVRPGRGLLIADGRVCDLQLAAVGAID